MNLRVKYFRTSVLAILGLMLSSVVWADDPSALENSIGVALGESCVIPIESGDDKNHEMRKNHMKYLFAKRDKTVHEGVRTDKFSLKACIDCHATVERGQPVKVNAPGQFCEGCHSYTAVSLDCFQCHATVPAKNSARLKAYLEKHPSQ